jgi:Zn-dependent peptidase ImmA (M78 family)
MERLAELVLHRNGVDAPPVDVDLIAEREGLTYEPSDTHVVSGAYYYMGGGRGRAFITRHEHPLRQVFTKAHELAHHLVDEQHVAHAAGYPLLQLPSGYRGRERHGLHDRFAAALLMPRSWIGAFMRTRGWRLERAQLIAAVGRHFGVSRRAAEVRLRELGHIS